MKKVMGHLMSEESLAPLAFFRMAFGILMAISMLRFYLNDWIESAYLSPQFHFTYQGFDWFSVPNEFIPAFFLIAGISALFTAFGFLYRITAPLFFLSFLSIELMDKAYYLNHYVLVSIMAFLLIFIPAHRNYSLDALIFKNIRRQGAAKFWLLALKIQVSLVYVFAGLAKINFDWLLEAQPLSIWLPAHAELPIIGPMFALKPTAYLFSWFAMVYDLSIPFLLWNARTRNFAYLGVIAFHGLTALLFPIGMFPYIMMATSLIFLKPNLLEKALSAFWLSPKHKELKVKPGFAWVLSAFLLVQIILPLRAYAQDGCLFWHEEGYRFGWRVMLMEKAGLAVFRVVDAHGNTTEVHPDAYLNAFQEKEMSTQPDMILEFAHFLYNEFGAEVEVYADVFVTLNGEGSKRYVDPNINLASIPLSASNREILIPADR